MGESVRTTDDNLTCPARCVTGTSDHIHSISCEFLGITPDAIRLHATDELLLCTLCGCVWRRHFDKYILRYRTSIVGTSTPLTRFCPAPWLNRVLSPKDAPADGALEGRVSRPQKRAEPDQTS